LIGGSPPLKLAPFVEIYLVAFSLRGASEVPAVAVGLFDQPYGISGSANFVGVSWQREASGDLDNPVTGARHHRWRLVVG